MRLHFWRFLIVGIAAVIFDFTVYGLCRNIFELNFALSKAISYSAGASLSFYFNGIWTFGKDLNFYRLLKHISTYLLNLFLNVICNSLLLRLFGNKQFLHILLAFGFTTLVTTLCNFILIRKWVFR